MLAVRIVFSDPAKQAERAAGFEAHKAYLRQASIGIIQSGPFKPAEGPAGALIVAEVADLVELQRFSDGDPFVISGVYATIHIVAWTVTIDRRERS